MLTFEPLALKQTEVSTILSCKSLFQNKGLSQNMKTTDCKLSNDI